MYADLLIHARWILPVEPADCVLDEHSLAVVDGRIQAILPSAQARQAVQAAREVELPGQALIPGLVNAHTHAPMTLMRGLADDLPLMTWLNEHIWPAERRWVDVEFVRAGTRLAVLEMLRGGVTCFNDMYFYPAVTAEVVAAAGQRAVVGMIVLDFPSGFAETADDYIDRGLELHAQYRDHPLIRTAFAPHSPYAVSDEPLARVRTLAGELGVPVHMHLHETSDEIEQSLRDHGERPLRRLDRMGLLGPQLVAVHMTQLEPEEIDRLAAAGAQVVHCPESNLKLASGFCPVAGLLGAGVNVAVGTDGAASNNDLNLLGEMRTAALLAKGVAGSAAAVPAAEVLRMATLNGARAFGLDAEIGSLQRGKAADVVAVDLSDSHTQPLYNPVSQLVYAAGRHQVRHVWVAGRQLIQEGQPTTLDARAIIAEAQGWAQRIAEGERHYQSSRK